MTTDDLKNTVYIKRQENYERGAIQAAVSEGMRELKFSPRGKVFVKPNVVVAHEKKLMGEHGCTPAPFVGAALLALSKAPGVSRIDVGEKSAIGIPTRLCYRYAGYDDELKKVKAQAGCPVDIFSIEEERRDSIFIGGLVHDNLRVARKMARADCKVYLPKLKCHCVSNVTAAVKLNVGICSDDERSIRHDFLLDDKIVDLLSVGYPDFTALDAIDVGVGNEAFPAYRQLGLIVMGKNPVAVDLIGARLLGFGPKDVPYLQRAIERGYGPASIEAVKIAGDLSSLAEVDEQAKRVLPYDDEFHRWQDVSKELRRLQSPIRFFWGPYREGGDKKCLTGCVMGVKMFLASFEKYSGPEAFKKARPTVIVVGNVEEEIDVKGNTALLYGSCAKARLINAKKVIHIDKCFTTASDMLLKTGARLGMRPPVFDLDYIRPALKAIFVSSFKKTVNLRYAQDVAHFVTKKLERRI